MEITPNGLQKELTTLLSELVFDTGFKKKKNRMVNSKGWRM